MDTTNSGQPMGPTPKKSGSGATVAIILIVILLAAGAYYYFTQVGGALDQEDAMMKDAVSGLNEQDTSDELADIEADLNATDISGLDAAAGEINAELQPQ